MTAGLETLEVVSRLKGTVLQSVYGAGRAVVLTQTYTVAEALGYMMVREVLRWHLAAAGSMVLALVGPLMLRVSVMVSGNRRH